jgi:hypothetical protein
MRTTAHVTISAAVAAAAAAAQAAGPVPGQGTWETTLKARDLTGDGIADAYCDTTLDITWLRDWNAAGLRSWNASRSWASSLVVGGVSGWRLPSMRDTGSPGCDFSHAGGTDCGYNVQTKVGPTVYSELAHMYYVTLGNQAACAPGDEVCAGPPQPGSGLTNSARLWRLRTDRAYWFDNAFEPATSVAWYFNPIDGFQSIFYEGGDVRLHAVAVRTGDVASAIPEPSTTMLALAGAAALAVAARRRAHPPRHAVAQMPAGELAG